MSETTESLDTTSTTPDVDGPDEAAMLAALRAARTSGDAPPESGGETAADGDGEAGAAGSTAPEAVAAPPADEEETELTRLRRERAKIEAEHAQREKIRAQVRAEFEEERRRAAPAGPSQEELLAQARREWLQLFQTDPVAAFREANVDGAAAVQRLAEAAGPEAKLHAKVASLEAALSRMTGDESPVAKRLAQIESERQREREVYEATMRQQEERALVATVERVAAQAPLVRAFFDDDAVVVRKGREIAAEYCQAKGVDTCPYDVIVQELRAEAKREAPKEIERLQARLAKLSSLLQQPAGAAVKPPEPNGRPGQRTLSARDASERRASPKPLSEMSEAEREEAARAAAREAMSGTRRGTKTIAK